MKALIVIVGTLLLPLTARAAITNIGTLFPATNPKFTQTQPIGSPAINATGSVVGESFTVFPDLSAKSGAFRYAHEVMSNLSLGTPFGITDDGAAWGGFLACSPLTAGIERLDAKGTCIGLPSTDNYSATGLSVSPDSQWVLGQLSSGGFGRPMLVWHRSTPNTDTYVFYNLGSPSDPFTDARFANPTSFSATNINQSGEFAVTASNFYIDSSTNVVTVVHAYLYRVNAGVATVAADLGEGVFANAINDFGDVAGLGPPLVRGNPQMPFIYSNGKVQNWDPSSISGWSAFFPPSIVGLNDKGQVAFSGILSDGSTHSFLRLQNGSLVDVGSIFPAGDIRSMIAVGLNNRGQITGWGTDYSVSPVTAYYTWIFTP